MQNDIIKRPPTEVADRSTAQEIEASDSLTQSTEKTVTDSNKPKTIKSLQATSDNIEPQTSKKDLKKQQQAQVQSQPKPHNKNPTTAIVVAVIFCLVLVGLVLYAKTS